jgi:hypothetical protein
MRSMSLIIAAAALEVVGFSGPASADDSADRNQAIQLCRAEVSARTGIAAEDVRLDNARLRPRMVRVDLDVWTNGALQNVRCDVRRGDALEIAEITPALQAAQTAAR